MKTTTNGLNPRYALLTVAQAAEVLGIDASQVRRIIRDRKLKARRLGERSYMILQRDLDAYRNAPQKALGRPRKLGQ